MRPDDSATTLPHISDTITTLMKGENAEVLLDNAGHFLFNTMPRIIGRSTTFVVDSRSASPLISTSTLPHKTLVRIGVRNEARTVDVAVRRTLSATSAFAMSETRLLAVPPGQQPTRASPRKCCGDSWKTLPVKYALSGMKKNWQPTPSKII